MSETNINPSDEQFANQPMPPSNGGLSRENNPSNDERNGEGKIRVVLAGLVGAGILVAALVWSEHEPGQKSEELLEGDRTEEERTKQIPIGTLAEHFAIEEVDKDRTCANINHPRSEEVELVDTDGDGIDDVVVPEIGIRKPVGEGGDERRRTDSFSPPLHGETAPDEYASYIAGLCQDPFLTAQLGHVLANIKIGDTTMGELNASWLSKYADITQLNDIAEGFLPGLDKSRLTDSQTERAVMAKQAHERDAARMIAVLDRLQLLNEKETITFDHTYTTEEGSLSIGNLLPEIEKIEVEYIGEMLVLEVRYKDGRCAFKVFINEEDRRAQASEECAIPPTTTTTTPDTTTTTTPPEGKRSSRNVVDSEDDGIPEAQDPTGTTVPRAETTTTTEAEKTDSGSGATNTSTPPTTEAPATEVSTTTSTQPASGRTPSP